MPIALIALILMALVGCHSGNDILTAEKSDFNVAEEFPVESSTNACLNPEDCDEDTVPMGEDNCPEIFNWDQKNRDGDDSGDACDSDLDGDGLGNTTDPCPTKSSNICTYNLVCAVTDQKTVSDCLQEIGNQPGTILFGENRLYELRWIGAPTLFPENIKVQIGEGAQIQNRFGNQIEIYGPLEAPANALSIITGDITRLKIFDPDSIVYASWFGHSPANNYQTNDTLMKRIMDLLVNGGMVQLSEGIYEHKLIEVANNTILKGSQTIIRFPDFPNQEEAAQIHSPNENFIAAEPGAIRVAIEDIEYDGNAMANISWPGRSSGANYPHWTREDMDATYTHGIYLGRFQNRMPPKYARLENLYLHDTIRDEIVVGGTTVLVKNVRLKNSLLDHLIYLSQSEPSLIENIVLEGYWANVAIVTFGQTFRNLRFENMEENPIQKLNGESPFKTEALLSRRSTSSPKRNYVYRGPSILRGLQADIGARIPKVGIQSYEAVDVQNLLFNQLEKREEPFSLLHIHTVGVATKKQRFFKAKDIRYTEADGSLILLNVQGDGSLIGENIAIQEVTILFKDGAPANETALVLLQDHTKNVRIKNLSVCNGAAPLLATSAKIRVSEITLAQVQMCDAKPPFAIHLNSGERIRLIDAHLLDWSTNDVHTVPNTNLSLQAVEACLPTTPPCD